MCRWLTNAALGAAGWTVGKIADVLLGKAVTAEPWPATTLPDREHYPEGPEGLEMMQRELNLQRELRRACARKAFECPMCGPVCLCGGKGWAGGWRF